MLRLQRSRRYNILMSTQVAGTFHKIIPEALLPLARVDHYSPSKEEVQINNLRAVIKNKVDQTVTPGTYTRLYTRKHQGAPWELMMSDTPYELVAGRPLLLRAHGDVVIAGLGLGATLLPVLRNPKVTSILVLENNMDVMGLVEPHLRASLTPEESEKFRVEWADALIWEAKDRRFDIAWLDIWPTISTENLPQINHLKRRFVRWLKKENHRRWVGAWEEQFLREEQRIDRRR